MFFTHTHIQDCTSPPPTPTRPAELELAPIEAWVIDDGNVRQIVQRREGEDQPQVFPLAARDGDDDDDGSSEDSDNNNEHHSPTDDEEVAAPADDNFVPGAVQ